VRRRSGRLIGLAILCVLLSSPVARADPTPISLQQYISRLDEALAAIRAVPTGLQNHAALEAAISSIGLPVVVSMPGGTVVRVTTESLLGPDPGFDTVTTRLQSAIDDAAAITSTSDAARVQAALAATYGGAKPQAPGLWQRITTYIGQAISWLLYHTIGAIFRAGWAGVAAIIVLVLLGVVAILFIRSAGRGVVANTRRLADSSIVRIDWRAEAERALAAGDLQAAVRALYHVMLETLASRGVVDGAPGLTAGECRDAVRRSRPGIYPDVERATLIFERVAYGDDPAQQAHVDSLREAEKKVRTS